MSSSTRRGRHAQHRVASASASNAMNTIRFNVAKEAFCSLIISECEPQYLDEIWQKLRRSYEAQNIRGGQPFPIWALQNLQLERMRATITMAYSKDLGALGQYAPTVPEHFKTEPWKFILFFNFIEQGRARILNRISKTRPTLLFQQVYEEVQQNRSNRLKALKNPAGRSKRPRAELRPADFRACLVQRSDHGNGRDEAFNDKCDDESESENEHGGNDNGGQEPHHRPINDHQEGNDDGDHNAQHSNNQESNLENDSQDIGIRRVERITIRDDSDDESSSSAHMNLPTSATNTPMSSPDDFSNMDEAQRTDVNPRQNSSLGLCYRVSHFVNRGNEDIGTQRQEFENSEKQFQQKSKQFQQKQKQLQNKQEQLHLKQEQLQNEQRQLQIRQEQLQNEQKQLQNREEQLLNEGEQLQNEGEHLQNEGQKLQKEQEQLQYKQKKIQEAESILAGLSELRKEHAAARSSVKNIDKERIELKKKHNKEEIELKKKRQVEEEGIAKLKIKKARLEAQFKGIVATSTNSPSIPRVDAS